MRLVPIITALVVGSVAIFVKQEAKSNIYFSQSSPTNTNATMAKASTLIRRQSENPNWREEGPWSFPIHAKQVICDDSQDRNVRLDYVRAVEALKSYCSQRQVGPGSMFVSVVNSTTVYMCSEVWTNPCHGAEWDEAEKYMDTKCGLGQAAAVKIWKWRKIYGRGVAGHTICSKLSYDEGYGYRIFEGYPILRGARNATDEAIYI